jgi:glutathione synthase
MPEDKSTRRIGVIMDAIASIAPRKDSTLAMMLEAEGRGMEVWMMQQADVRLLNGRAFGHMRRVHVFDDPANWFEIGEARDAPLGELDALLMRKDPPFDMEYIYTSYILDRAQAEGCLVVNRPSSLRDMNEKAYTAWFPELCPDTLITRSMQEMKAFLGKHDKIVVKPLDGMGGRSIFTVTRGDKNTNVILETLTDFGRRYAIAQTFLPEITDGDKRVLLVDGEPVPYMLARVPNAEDGRGNLVMGATGEGRPLGEREREICRVIGPVLRDKGILFAGIDVIGDYMTEINVTSPTGIREIDRQFGINIAGLLFDAIERHLGA